MTKQYVLLNAIKTKSMIGLLCTAL